MNNILFNRIIIRKNSYQLEKVKPGWKIPVVSSTMFETMINNESRKKYICYLLSLIIDKDMNYLMEHIRFVKAELDKSNYHQSRKTVDLVCEIDDKIYNIELNNFMEVEGLERNVAYINDLYKSKMHRGSDYDYQHSIQINLCNFVFDNNDKVLSESYLRDEEGILLTDKIRIIYIYLPMIREKYYNKEKLSELEKLLLVFNEQETEELKSLMEDNLIMKEYHEDAKDASQKEEIIGLYDKELYDEMMEYHRIKNAIEEEKIEIARRLLEMKMPVEDIMKVTGISKQEIEKII